MSRVQRERERERERDSTVSSQFVRRSLRYRVALIHGTYAARDPKIGTLHCTRHFRVLRNFDGDLKGSETFLFSVSR
jgi:hypothetical protein